MDAEFADLIPLFVEEARDRLERLATCVPRLEGDPQSVVEAKRELHTLKGAGRMMRIGALAELCHAAEEVLQAARPGMIALQTTGLFDGFSSTGPAVVLVDDAGLVSAVLDTAPPGVELVTLPAGVMLSPGFIDLLREHDSTAVLILYHFWLLWAAYQHLWYVQDLALRSLPFLEDLLDEIHRPWLEWAKASLAMVRIPSKRPKSVRTH